MNLARLHRALLVLLLLASPSPAPAGEPLPGLTADVARLDQPSNPARFDALTALLRERGVAFEVQTFVSERPEKDSREQGRNVIVTVGTGPREIVVGAHFDAVRLADRSLGHAMVDNAAGTIVLIRLAEALQKRSLQHRVRIVFFDMEEIGLLGSAHFAQSLDKAKVEAMVNLDIAGYGDTVIFGPAAQEGNGKVYDAMKRTCAASRRTCLEFPRFPSGDDRSFQAAGIPNISVAVLPALEAHQLWLLLNGGKESGLREGFLPRILQTIHTPEDKLEKVDAAGMTLAYEAVLALVLELDAARPGL